MKKIFVDTKNKEFMFKLGYLFASGDIISILNPQTVDKNIEEEIKLGHAKSFNMMIKFWQDLNMRPSFNIASNEKKVFIICPVRNATTEEKQKLNEIVKQYELNGYATHYPERDTNQNPFVCELNTGGYNICLQNTRANAQAKTIVLFYNKESVGSMFDLGASYFFKLNDPSRKIVLANNVTLDPNDFVDNKVLEMINNKEVSIEI